MFWRLPLYHRLSVHTFSQPPPTLLLHLNLVFDALQWHNPKTKLNLHTTLWPFWPGLPAHRSANYQGIISNPMSADVSAWLSVASLNGVTFFFHLFAAECHHGCFCSSSVEILSVPHYLINHQKYS